MKRIKNTAMNTIRFSFVSKIYQNLKKPKEHVRVNA